MGSHLGYREVLALTLEQLAKHPTGSYDHLVTMVLKAWHARRVRTESTGSSRVYHPGRSPGEAAIAELVRQAMWECLLKRIMIFGKDELNADWPFYRVTEYGKIALENPVPQPYDPDGFLAHFDRVCPNPDSVVRSYLEEALLAFNSGCERSAAVMLGCASEQLILLLCDAVQTALEGSHEGIAFTKNIEKHNTIYHKFNTVKGLLEARAKELPRAHAEAISSYIPSGFEMVRSCRNAAGHPRAIGDINSDTIFMNLRIFTEYARCIMALVEHFRASQSTA